MKKELRQKIKDAEKAFLANHVFPKRRRAVSCRQLTGKYSKYTILDEREDRDTHMVFTHPTHKYLKFVKEHASNDFAKLRAEANGDEIRFKYLRK